LYVSTADYFQIAMIEEQKNDEAYACLFEKARRTAVYCQEPSSGVQLMIRLDERVCFFLSEVFRGEERKREEVAGQRTVYDEDLGFTSWNPRTTQTWMWVLHEGHNGLVRVRGLPRM
jgi:hypothetical protein